MGRKRRLAAIERQIMERHRLMSMECFQEFQNRDAFFETLTNEKDMGSRIARQCALLAVFSAVCGVVMGVYNGALQAISSGIRVPLPFVPALLICFAAFFILQHVLGSKLGFRQVLAGILSGFVMIALVMAAFAPIVLFFLITGDNYAFLKLRHVLIFALAGAFGMKTVLDGLKFCCETKNVCPKVGVVVFRFWIAILAFVGMQLAWNLRPFIGSRDLPLQMLRQREGNFYLTVARAAADLVKAGATPKRIAD
jgi:hypothetical protein